MRKLIKVKPSDLVFIGVFLIIVFFFFYRVGKGSINNDAQFWYTRTQNFVHALKTHTWNETYQNAKPGVSVMWMSGLSLETFRTLYNKLYGFRPEIYTYETFPLVHLSVIGPLLVVGLCSILLSFIILKKYLNSNIVVLGIVLLGFQPIFVGISRDFHSDASLSAFMLMSTLIAMYYLMTKQKYIFIILSGIFASLAVLSKSSGIFMLPYLGLLLLIDLVFLRKPLIFYVKTYLIWLISLCVFFFAVFPAMWLKPIEILKRIFIYEGMYLVTVGRDGINGPLYYINQLSRMLSPIFLVSFVCGLLFLILKFKNLKNEHRQVFLSMIGFVLFYFIQMSIAMQKMDRYIFPILPFTAIIGGFGIYNLIENAKILRVKIFLYILFFSINLGLILYFFPNYLIFPSEEGKDQYGCSLCSDIGDYLNSKDNPADLKIISVSEKVHRLKPFVRGKVYTTKETLPSGWSADYLVKAKTEIMPENYTYCVLETNISFRGVDYWEIYRCK